MGPASVTSATSALLLYDEIGGLWLGSAICLHLGDRHLLATAAHNLHRISHVRAIPMGRYRSDPIRSLATGRGGSDLAWVELSSEDVRRYRPAGLRLEDIDCRVPSESAPLLAHGFPSSDVDPRSVAGTRFDLEGSQIAGRSVHRSPDVIALVCDPEPRHGELQPTGFSGGGIWRRASDGRYRLTGLARAWKRSDRVLLGVPIRRWLRLVARDFPELRLLIEGTTESTTTNVDLK